MSLALQALGGEVRARGSMLRDAATSYLSRKHGVTTASKAHAMVEQGASLGYYKVEGGSLFPVERANPTCPCKVKVHQAIAAVPKRHANKVAQTNPVKACPKPVKRQVKSGPVAPAPAPKPVKRAAPVVESPNPVKACPKVKLPKGKLSTKARSSIPPCAFADPKGKRFPLHDVGHAKAAIPRLAQARKAGTVTATQYKVFRKRIEDALRGFGVEVSAGSAGRKSTPASNTQEKTPMAKARKAKKAKKATKAPKAPKARKPRRTAKQKAATKKLVAANKKRAKKAPKARKPRRAAKRRAAPRKARKAARRAAPRKARKAARRAAPRKARKATRRAAPRRAARRAAPRRAARKAARMPRTVRTIVRTTTTTSKRNPIGSVKMLAVGMVATGIGFGGAEIIDRLIVTRANQKAADGTNVNPDKPLVGYAALLIRSNVPDGYRFAAAGGGTAVLGVGTYLLSRYTRSDIGVAIMGGMAFGFGLKLASLGLGYVIPKILPVKSGTENTWQNQLFPENYFDQPAPAGAQAGSFVSNQADPLMGQGHTFGGPRRFGSGAVSRQDFGPTAGSTGCGCAHAQSQASGSPKAGEGQPDNRQALNTETEQPPTGGVSAPRMFIVSRSKRTR